METLALLLSLALGAAQPVPYGWLETKPADTLGARFAPPEGFTRVPVAEASYPAWLRGLPLLPGRGEVHLFDGKLKANQAAHLAVVDIDVGKRDLQQCADAVIRLRAEYLHAANRPADLCFHFTDGTPAPWTRWADGFRPKVAKKVTWSKSATPDSSRAAFRSWLDTVFNYAGTASLSKEVEPVLIREVRAGDLFVQGGFPGHAVTLVDVATDKDGNRAVLLAQSYMPAQQIHVIDNPAHPGDPWYVLTEGPLATAEWTFPDSIPKRWGKPCRAPP